MAQVLLNGGTRWTAIAVAGTAQPLAWRRQRPVAAFLVQFFFALASAQPPTWAGMLALFVGLYSVSVYTPSRRRSLVVVLFNSAVLLIAPVAYALITHRLYERWDAVLPAPVFQLLLGVVPVAGGRCHSPAPGAQPPAGARAGARHAGGPG